MTKRTRTATPRRDGECAAHAWPPRLAADASGTERQPYLADPDVALFQGDVREVLPMLEAESVDCVMTSPPFYALRDYGVDGQIGLEETPEQWAAELVSVFAECKRVLKDTGTLWVECGDSYARVGGAGVGGSFDAERPGWHPRKWRDASDVPHGLKPKDILLQPFMLAMALRAAGWYLRQVIIWHKPNCMPESAKDRCTTAHSYVFLFSKRPRYWFDAEAIAEEFSENTHGKRSNATPKSRLNEDGSGGNRNNKSFADAIPISLAPSAQRVVPQIETLDGSEGELPRGPDGRRVTHVQKGENSLQHRDGDRWPNEQRHPRSVWTIPTQPYSEAHFATWPEALCERIIKAGCPEGGTVLDPFLGSGTTALVARKLGRRSIGIELNADYCALAAKRLQQLSLLAPESVEEGR